MGLTVLLLAVKVWLVVESISSLDVKSVSVPFGLMLVDSCGSVVGSLDSLDSLDSVGAGESGLDSGMVSAFGFSVSTVAADWPLMAMR